MKLYKKESPTEEAPVLLQLQRRHTLAEGDQNIDEIKATAHNTTYRSNSVSSADATLNSSQVTTEFQAQKSVDTTLSPEGNRTSLSTASTVVITESELSSSWLYKNKKAQMNTASPFESTCDSSAPLAPSQDEQPAQDKSPMIPRPIKNKNGTNNRSKNVTSCCCYTTAVCIICLTTLGIIAVIANIIFMEIFYSYNVTSTQLNEETNFTSDREIGIHDLIPMQKIGDLLNDENETILSDIQTSDLKLSIDPLRLSNSKHIYQKNDVNSSYVESKDTKKESNDDKDIVDEEMETDTGEHAILSTTNASSLGNESLSETDRVKDHAEDLFEKLELTVNKLPNITDGFSIESLKDESPYSKLFQLYNLHNTKLKNLTTLEEVSVPVIRNVSDSRNFELPENNSDFNHEAIIEDKFESIVTRNDFDLILKHNSDIETNKTGDLESLLINSLPPHGQVLEEDETLKNTDLELNQAEHFESLLTKSLPHSGQILKVENISLSLKNNSEHEDEPEHLEQFPIGTLSRDQISEREVRDSLKNNSETMLDKIDHLEPVLVKSLLHQEEDLKAFKRTENRNKEHENNRQEQNLKNNTEITIKSHGQTENRENEHKENNTQEHNLKNNIEVPITPFGINQPVVGANIAVPGPVELFKRLMMERETNVKPVRQDDHDRRFSLAQALETLRKLDVNNQLPSSRQKPMLPRRPSESQNRNIQHKMQGQEQDSERSHYLENLRKKFYDN